MTTSDQNRSAFADGGRPAPAGADAEQNADPAALQDAMGMLRAIRAALGRLGDQVQVPAKALLLRLPPELRGPEWNADSWPSTNISVPRDTLLAQLGKGRIEFPITVFLPELPPGWVNLRQPDHIVELDLPTVVQSVPPEWLGGAARVASEVEEVSTLRDYFSPREARPPEPAAIPAAAAVPSAAPTVPLGVPSEPVTAAPAVTPFPAAQPALARKKSAATARIPGLWDGYETGPSAAVNGVDINRATAAELQRLSGIGPGRAAVIVGDRAQHGPFDGIYDLTRVRGIGRKFFQRITGLSLRLRERRDRREALNELLGLPKDERPSISRIVELAVNSLDVEGAALAGRDGIVIASAGNAGDFERLAAVVPLFFRRAGRHFRKLTGQRRMPCVVLPLAEPPIALFDLGSFYLILWPKRESGLDASLPRAEALAGEIEWLLSRRAMVARRP